MIRYISCPYEVAEKFRYLIPGETGAETVRQQGERGSIAIELAFLAPVVLLILALIWGYGRVAWANGHL